MVRLILIFLLIAIVNSTFWMSKEFGEVYPYEFFYHLFFGLNEFTEINQDYFFSFIQNGFILPACASVLIYLIIKFINRAQVQSLFVIKLINITNSFFKIRVLLLLITLSIIWLLVSINIQILFTKTHDGDFFKNNYVAPQLEKILAPKVKRNLILIFVESLSAEYENTIRYPDDLLKDIKALTENNTSLQFKQALHNRWTQSGIFDSMCGAPLKHNFAMRFQDKPREKSWNIFSIFFKPFNSYPKYAPKIICLGDVLKHHGYKNIFMGGADLNFAGKGQFLTQHGYDIAYGKQHWENLGERDFNQWGLHDDRLFLQAKKILLDPDKLAQPFNLTMLTLNLHEPHGFTDKTCESKNIYDYKGLVKCTDHALADFVQFFYTNELQHTTDLVILGDHNPRSKKSLVDGKETDNQFIFNRFISETKLQLNRSMTYHFGIFPSILNMLGFTFPNNQLGIEPSFFGEAVVESAISKLKPEELNEFINQYSEFYSKLMYSHEK